MDPGLQVYGGRTFKALRSAGDEAFLSLPAPRAAKDETMLPCEACGRMVPFCDYGEHLGSNCGTSRRPAAARAPARERTPSPDMQQYYAGSGGG
mmetsp:Transcript_21773/g.32807  ORF Transcript_21773/g.32807 Transcript_21773/m.32807 type:complete len:94 (-) Transcript_21773:110-391(-)